METNHTRRLLKAIQALAVIDVNEVDILAELLPAGYLDSYSAGDGNAFDGDPLDIFAVALEDYFWENEEAVKSESPAAHRLLTDEISDLFEPSEPKLHLNNPAVWKTYRRDLQAFAQKLDAVCSE